MTLYEAKHLSKGDYVHSVSTKNADGSPMRARITSVKTWKRKPKKIEVHVKHGLYDYAVFDETELQLIERGYK